MNRLNIAQRLQELPAEIEVAELAVIDAVGKVDKTRSLLTEKEGALLTDKIEGVKIDGKNAETRQAQLREFTKGEREKVASSEEILARGRVLLNKLQNELKALHSVALILGREVA